MGADDSRATPALRCRCGELLRTLDAALAHAYGEGDADGPEAHASFDLVVLVEHAVGVSAWLGGAR